MKHDPQLQQFLSALTYRLDPVARFRRAIGEPDLWQQQVLLSDPVNEDDQFIQILCSRRMGKSTVVGGLAYDDLSRGHTAILLGPTMRQSTELMRRVLEFRAKDPHPPRIIKQNQSELETENGGRVLCLPASDNARGAGARTVIFGEAAFMDDDAITACLPFKDPGGRILMLSTPKGREGYFYESWVGGKVKRIWARSVDPPRMAERVAFDRRHMPDFRFRIEHMTEFLGAGLPLIGYDTLDRAINQNVSALCLN